MYFTDLPISTIAKTFLAQYDAYDVIINRFCMTRQSRGAPGLRHFLWQMVSRNLKVMSHHRTGVAVMKGTHLRTERMRLR
jgi:hypothetical protein